MVFDKFETKLKKKKSWTDGHHPYFLLGLVLHTHDALTNVFLVTQVATSQWTDGVLLWDGLEVLIEVIDQRHGGGDVQLGDLIV